MITPLDIENKKFSKKTLNGYDYNEFTTTVTIDKDLSPGSQVS